MLSKNQLCCVMSFLVELFKINNLQNYFYSFDQNKMKQETYRETFISLV